MGRRPSVEDLEKICVEDPDSFFSLGILTPCHTPSGGSTWDMSEEALSPASAFEDYDQSHEPSPAMSVSPNPYRNQPITPPLSPPDDMLEFLGSSEHLDEDIDTDLLENFMEFLQPPAMELDGFATADEGSVVPASKWPLQLPRDVTKLLGPRSPVTPQQFCDSTGLVFTDTQGTSTSSFLQGETYYLRRPDRNLREDMSWRLVMSMPKRTKEMAPTVSGTTQCNAVCQKMKWKVHIRFKNRDVGDSCDALYLLVTVGEEPYLIDLKPCVEMGECYLCHTRTGGRKYDTAADGTKRFVCKGKCRKQTRRTRSLEVRVPQMSGRSASLPDLPSFMAMLDTNSDVKPYMSMQGSLILKFAMPDEMSDDTAKSILDRALCASDLEYTAHVVQATARFRPSVASDLFNQKTLSVVLQVNESFFDTLDVNVQQLRTSFCQGESSFTDIIATHCIANPSVVGLTLTIKPRTLAVDVMKEAISRSPFPLAFGSIVASKADAHHLPSRRASMDHEDCRTGTLQKIRSNPLKELRKLLAKHDADVVAELMSNSFQILGVLVEHISDVFAALDNASQTLEEYDCHDDGSDSDMGTMGTEGDTMETDSDSEFDDGPTADELELARLSLLCIGKCRGKSATPALKSFLEENDVVRLVLLFAIQMPAMREQALELGSELCQLPATAAWSIAAVSVAALELLSLAEDTTASIAILERLLVFEPTEESDLLSIIKSDHCLNLYRGLDCESQDDLNQAARSVAEVLLGTRNVTRVALFGTSLEAMPSVLLPHVLGKANDTVRSVNVGSERPIEVFDLDTLQSRAFLSQYCDLVIVDACCPERLENCASQVQRTFKHSAETPPVCVFYTRSDHVSVQSQIPSHWDALAASPTHQELFEWIRTNAPGATQACS